MIPGALWPIDPNGGDDAILTITRIVERENGRSRHGATRIRHATPFCAHFTSPIELRTVISDLSAGGTLLGASRPTPGAEMRLCPS